MKKIILIITPEQVAAHPNYSDGNDCPAYHAMKEQHPDVEFSHIGSYGSLVIEKRHHLPKEYAGFFHDAPWSSLVHMELLQGRRTEPVILTYNIF